ncbi:hypothetical protein MWU52_16310 [Jannaschia sp. S6380]|uniref:hypothetical protein n=1 Tax=Jannaschia sp. S6380 TaxID=2926408 RepID=UPI001FF50070|nr:hypothetical protein [Jannaschia sp. S6380]MCK0169119.1 hypothetical protein [Jannaschia sp. S6380]
MKPLVLASLEDRFGDRCVDILRGGAAFGWVECRRDPEDAHGWRHLHPPRLGFATEDAARDDATRTVGWLVRDGASHM